jgi:hypothetical protein
VPLNKIAPGVAPPIAGRVFPLNRSAAGYNPATDRNSYQTRGSRRLPMTRPPSGSSDSAPQSRTPPDSTGTGNATGSSGRTGSGSAAPPPDSRRGGPRAHPAGAGAGPEDVGVGGP